jgi:predicted ATPase
LKQLVEAELVFQSGIPPQVQYLFKHALVRDTAYQSLLKSRRHSGENQGEAEACFRQAIDIARRQSAKSLELQVAMSLARLWQQQGKTAEVHQMLAEIYDWFTEGFDTIDLQEAKTLLEELH